MVSSLLRLGSLDQFGVVDRNIELRAPREFTLVVGVFFLFPSSSSCGSFFSGDLNNAFMANSGRS